MAIERERLLVLALETLQNKKSRIEAEIAELTRELRGPSAVRPKPARVIAATAVKPRRKQTALSEEERLRRSRRMKEYWVNWRKQRNT